MKKHAILTLLLKSFVCMFLTMTILPKAGAQINDSVIFENDISAFENSDKVNPPKEGIVLFIGSSSIRLWSTLSQDMAPIPVINRGYGGSRIRDSIAFADRIVLPYKPSKIVFYAGENDIAGGLSPEDTAADFKKFAKTVRQALPGTPIYFISIKPSPIRDQFKDKILQANKLIKAFCESQKNVTFVDVYSAMLNADGSYKGIYLDDKLHMNAEGYKIWTGLIKPLIRK